MHDNKIKFTAKVCEQIRFKTAHYAVKEELETHIDERVYDYIAEGFDKQEATVKAIQCMGDPVELGSQLNKIHKPYTEWTVICSIILLSLFGAGILFFIGDLPFGNGSIFGQRQIIYTVLGWGLLVAIIFFDYTKLNAINGKIFILGLLLTFITVLFGTVDSGLLYLRVGIISFRTVSICNFMFMIAIIVELNKKRGEGIAGFIKIGGLCTIALTTLVINRNFNLLFSMLIVYAIIFTISLRKQHFHIQQGWLYLSITYGIMLISLLVLTLHMLPRDDIQFKSYLINSQWIGESIFLNANGWVHLPENWTDYFFTIIIAHFGRITGYALISVFFIFLGTMIFKSIKVKNCLGFYLAIGSSLYLLINFIINILSCLGLIGKVTSSLPFVSFGTTDYITNILAAGLFLSIWRRHSIVPADMPPVLG